MTPIDSQTAQNLITHREWLRNLARGLVRDDSRAEDLCQETLLHALGRPLATQASRPWLARAVRSLGARLGRDEQRRQRREAAAARREGQPSAAQVVEQVANQQLVLEAVMKLEEPYRSTILLRYWEDLPPREVALRLTVPVETVRTRLKRGLALLRQQLDREFGGRRAWMMPISTFVFLGKKSFLLACGAAVVKTKTIAVAAVLVAGLALTWNSWSDASEGVPEPVDRQPSTPSILGSAGSGDSSAPMERVAVRTPSVAPAGRPEAVEPVVYFRGRVLDAEAVPLASVGVRMQGLDGAPLDEELSSRSDETGYFSLERPGNIREIVVDEEGLTTVLVGVVQPSDSAEPVVVAASSLMFGGVVMGETGQRLSGAQIACTLPEDFRARFGAVLDFSREELWTVHAGEDGTFHLPELGRVEGAELHFSLDGYLPVTMPQPDASDENMQVVLNRPTPVDGSLIGQVVDASGVPVPEARVSLGNTTTVSDEDGRFIVDMQAAGKNLEIIAMKRGYLPGTYQLREWEGDFRAGDQAFATVRLGDQPLSISGELVDSEGRGMAGAKVWVLDPTVFGDPGDGLGLISVEGYLSGGSTAGELMARFMRNGQPVMPVEQILDENPTAKWSWVKTDEDGRFTLSGLQNRSYQLAAMLPETLVRVDSDPFPAGITNARMVIPAGAVIPLVAGRVTSRAGIPIAGVQVQMTTNTVELNRVTYSADGRRRSHGSGRSETGGSDVTDVDGRFEFKDVGGNLVYLNLYGNKIMPTSFGRPIDGGGGARVRSGEFTSPTSPLLSGLAAVGQPVDNLVIQVSLRLHMRIELSNRDLADQVGALNAEGQRINLSIMSGGGVDSYDRVTLSEGRSQVLSVPESVTTLVLIKGGEEVRRISVLLEPGDVNVIRG